MNDPSDESLPISDEPTRDFSVTQGTDGESWNIDEMSVDGMSASPPSGLTDAPKQLGDYELRGLIGSGGMGNVYLAEHIRMQRIVAIKMLPIERMGNAESVERFYAEVRAASRLLHPNIVTAFDAGEVEAGEFGVVHFLAMEYVDGMTLTQAIAANGPMSVGEAAAAIRQAAIGLLHAHRSGIVHRDVKPGNLMRASDGTVKVLDLGLAQMRSSAMFPDSSENGDEVEGLASAKSSSRGRLIGTLPFMSPEQLEDPDSVDARSDIYSLGATLYFLLTATPPFTGEYLDQVYGHRHGEIPDLMQARDDVDMNFAHIFSRMMAKSPGERYESLDEVIDELSEYASETDTPNWLAEFSQRHAGTDISTFSGGSTAGATACVLGLDFGMFYSSLAIASPDGSLESLSPGRGNHRLFRNAIASEPKLCFDSDAIDLRANSPQTLVHCIPMYIGNKVVSRSVAGRQCPPEVLLAMLMKQAYTASNRPGPTPQATAITVPSSYDQLHRRSILQAAEIAGLSSVRLIDRCVAAVQSLGVVCAMEQAGTENELASSDAIAGDETDNEPMIGKDLSELLLYVSITGQAAEVALIRRTSSRLVEIATAGHWLQGTLPWLQRLVDMAAGLLQNRTGIDPKKKSSTATQLQIECEKVMNAMLLLPEANLTITINKKPITITLNRQDWLVMCEDLMESVQDAVKRCFKNAALDFSRVDSCVSLGALLKIKSVRERILPNELHSVPLQSIDRADVARGAAACLASELPGRVDTLMPPRTVTSQTIGILVEDAKGRRRILPIIPQGTLLPARTNRRLSASSKRESMTISLVESAGIQNENWQTLGRYDIDVGSPNAKARTRTISFELNVNGLLVVRAPLPTAMKASGGAVHTSTKLAPLPTPNLSDAEIEEWKRWVDRVME